MEGFATSKQDRCQDCSMDAPCCIHDNLLLSSFLFQLQLLLSITHCSSSHYISALPIMTARCSNYVHLLKYSTYCKPTSKLLVQAVLSAVEAELGNMVVLRELLADAGVLSSPMLLIIFAGLMVTDLVVL